MTELRERAAGKPGVNLLQVVLQEGALTAATIHAATWRVWQAWSDSAARRAGTGGARDGRCLGKQATETAEVVHLVPQAGETGRFELFVDTDGAHRFRLVTAAGEPILTSRNYADARSARGGMKTLMTNAVRDDRYRRAEDPLGAYTFEIRAGNNRVLWASPPYETVEALESALARLLRTAQSAAAGT